MLGIEFAALQACSLRADQRGAAHKVIRAVFGPRLELAVVDGQALSILGALGVRRRLAERDQRQRSVKVVVGPFEDGWRHPEEAFGSRGRSEGGRVVVSKDARLQLAYPVHPGGYPKTRLALQPPFELLLGEPVVVEAPENGRQTAESPDQTELCGDEAADEIEMSAAREVEPGLGLALHLGERSATGEELREEVVAANRCVGEVAGLLGDFEGVPGERASRPNMPRRWFGEIPEGQVDTGSQAFHSRLIRQVKPKLAEAEPGLVVAEGEAQHIAHRGIGVARRVAIAVLQAEVAHSADHETA